MSSPSVLFRSLLACFLGATVSARAHQPYEITTAVRVEGERLVMTLTMPAEAASAMIGKRGPAEETRTLSRGNFARLQPQIETQAREYFQVRAGDAELAMIGAVAQMNGEGELEVTLRYPAPKQWPLRVRPAFLGLLPQGYGNTFAMFDAEDRAWGRWLQTSAGKVTEIAEPPLAQTSEVVAAIATVSQPKVVESEAPPVSATALDGFLGLAMATAGAAIVAFFFLRVRRKPLARRTAAVLLALAVAVSTADAQRQMEKLGRGVIAIKSSSTQVYVGWRLLGNDPEDVAFNLYRAANGGLAVKINATPLIATTDYTDTPGGLSTTAYTYSVRPVVGGIEVADMWAHPLSAGFTLPANAPTRQYLPIPLQATPDGALNVKFCWVGDLDGDGDYDFVVDRQPSIEARQFLEAYKRDGTLLWRMDMGPNSVDHYNIEPGSSAISIGHGDNVTVYDMDGDGRAEVIVRTANGVVFGNGATVIDADDRKQFVSIVDGLSGVELARGPVPNARLSDGPMNGHMGIVHLDGRRPSVLLASKNRASDESFHGSTTVWDFRDGVLTQRWSYNAETFGQHAPQAHQIRLGDPDNDGKDEFLDIGYGIDDTGLQLFSVPEIVHGDRFHMADIDPDRPGLETYLIQQDNGTGLATAMIDSATGTFLKKWYAAGVVDVGRGLAADIDPTRKGYEIFSTQPGIFDSKGSQIYNDRPFPPEAIWWDGNLSREFLATVGSTAESPAIARFDPANPGNQARIYTIYNETAPGVYWAYGGRPQFTGDILGDWREEIVVAANDNSELRIYTTKSAAANRLYTLMHNPQYRVQVTTKGYAQSSYVDYFLGDGMTPPPPPPMVDAQLVWRGGVSATTWDVGVTPSWLRGAANSTFANGDTVRFDIGGENATTVVLSGALLPGAVTVWSPKSYIFDGTNGSLGGAMKLMKTGAGALTISGPHVFTGKTTVWDGALLVNGTLQGSAVTVWGGTFGGVGAAGLKGGRIGGTGTFGQQVMVKYRGAITPGAGMGSAGTLTFSAGLTAEDGSVLALDLSNDPSGTTTPGDRIAVTGNLVLSGKVNVLIKALTGTPAPGTYTLLTYTGTLTGGLGNLSVTAPVGVPYTLAVGGGAITITVPVTRAADAVVWRGSGGMWDLASSQNWLRNSAPDIFVAGDAVTFDATGAAAPTVTLSTVLPIASLTVNAANNYTFNGAGSIYGSGGLTKSGAGTLTINTTNDYTGPTTINGGVLAVANIANAGSPSSIGAASASASNLVLNGGTLRLTGAQSNTNRDATLGAGGGTFDVASGSSSMLISGSVSGSGTLTKAGPGTLLLGRTNNYTGGTVINAGTIYLAGSNANETALGNGAVTMNNGTLTMADVQNNDVSAWNLIVPAGATARLNADGRCSLTGSLIGGGDFTFYTGFIRTDLKGNWSAFSGRIFAVTDGDGGDLRVTNTAGYVNAALNLGAEIYAHYNLTGAAIIDVGELSGATTSVLAGGITNNTVTWRVGAKHTSSTFAGTIVNRSGQTALTKIGSGTLTLAPSRSYVLSTSTTDGSLTATIVHPDTTAVLRAFMPVLGAGIVPGTSIAAVVDSQTVTLSQPATTTGTGDAAYVETSTYTGATTVSAGRLIVDTVIASSNVTVASGAMLGGTGTLRGNATFNSGSTLAFSVANGAISGLDFRGNLTMNGTINVTLGAGAGGFAQGIHTIATYAGALGGTPTFVWNPPPGSTQTATFDTSTPGVIRMNVSRNAGTLLWTGADSSAWDTSTTNWTLNGAPEVFTPPDSALFDDSAANTTVTLAGPLVPGAVTFDHSTKNYTLSGTDVQGMASLTKVGTGTLTVSGAQTFTGGVSVEEGVIAIGGGSANGQAGLGSGKISFRGGRLNMNGLTGSTTPSYGAFANPLEVLAGENGTIGVTQRGDLAGPLTGAGTLTLAVNYVRGNIGGNWSAFTGTLNVTATDSGTDDFRINNPAGFPAAAVSLGANVSARYLGNAALTVPIGELSGVAASSLIGLNNNNNAVGAHTLTWEVGARGTDAAFAGTISNGTSPSITALRKVGAGVWTLAGNCNYTGGTTVVAGTLRITGTVSGTASLNIAAGAAIEMSGGTFNVAGPITNSGTVRLYGASALASTGTFTNNGVLDLINGPQSLPANFINNGVVLDSSSVRVQSITQGGGNIQLGIQSYPGHNYRMQRRDALTAGDWANAGAAQAGTGGVLIFTDAGVAGAAGFYRIVVAP